MRWRVVTSETSHRGGPGFISVQSIWDLRWIKWHWGGFLFDCCSCTATYWSVIHPRYINVATETLTAWRNCRVYFYTIAHFTAKFQQLCEAHGTWHMAHGTWRSFSTRKCNFVDQSHFGTEQRKTWIKFWAKKISFESFYNTNCNFQWFPPRAVATMYSNSDS